MGMSQVSTFNSCGPGMFSLAADINNDLFVFKVRGCGVFGVQIGDSHHSFVRVDDQ